MLTVLVANLCVLYDARCYGLAPFHETTMDLLAKCLSSSWRLLQKNSQTLTLTDFRP